MVYLRLIKTSTGHCDAVNANAAMVSHGETSLHGFQCITITKSNGEIHRFNVVQSTLVIKGYISVPDPLRKSCHLHTEHVYWVEGYHSSTLPERSNFDGSQIGIIGHDEAIEEIMSSVFEPRKISSKKRDALSYRTPRGVILYGPPGTGKTSLVRGICKYVGIEPNVVNGPELLNKFTSVSERAVRELFDGPINVQTALGDESPLYVIVLEEMDSLFPARSMKPGASDTRNSVTSQLLCMMDGYTQLNNLVIFGTTNRLDMIDPTVLRGGRFEMRIKIGLPNAQCRFEILKFTTNKLRRNAILAPDITESVLIGTANATEGYSGADLVQIVKQAGKLAMGRTIKEAKTDDIGKLRIDESKIMICLNDIRIAHRTLEYRRRAEELDKPIDDQ